MALGLGAVACCSAEHPVEAPAVFSNVAPRLPTEDGPYFPSLTQSVAGSQLLLEDAEACMDCHQGVAAMFSKSAHAFSSFNNPVYRTSVMELRTWVGFEESKHCGGCHDPALLVDGAMDNAIDFADLKSSAGVNCKLCHGMVHSTSEGNGSYTLADSPLPLPSRGNDDSVLKHKWAVKSAGNKSCAPCHRSFLTLHSGNRSFVAGSDDWGTWQMSAYNGQGIERIDTVARANCIDCHMPYKEGAIDDPASKGGKIRGHDFLGSHTFLSALRGDSSTVDGHKKMLQGAVTVDVAAIKLNQQQRIAPAEEAQPSPGDHIEIDVVLVNQKVGHRFPGGTTDSQNTWIELVVVDAVGKVLLVAGKKHAEGKEDISAHVLTSYVADNDGKLVRNRGTHKFVAPIFDHTIAPRDAVVVRYEGELPIGFKSPLTIKAQLKHRSHNTKVHGLSCPTRFDKCVDQPTAVVAVTRRLLNGKIESQGLSERLLDHGRALNHHTQEHLEEARPSLMASLSKAKTVFLKAQSQFELGRLESMLGRSKNALRHFEEAEELVGPRPAIDYAKANVYSKSWQWSKAAKLHEMVSDRVPENEHAFERLALALGSMGESDKALRAAQKGLALNLRNSELLRVQALSLKEMNHPDASKAMDAYLRVQEDDEANQIRLRCAQIDPRCALEKRPIHSHVLTPP